ncbi:hypothetical protein ETD86_25160 [Nonomuraea turkmeniaca]|uniref:Uncharacterized protein n=1 Tax=Nonomuraea turkmeniaca TaxID=103838 RepID=A0A5S4FDM3_9ACTN|nr:hypothetical protein [Nonomuraea turkmeniaca]TMR16500.1 hypothetical protein ETD86_25160 [Nonomuraea turkmeniaca]
MPCRDAIAEHVTWRVPPESLPIAALPQQSEAGESRRQHHPLLRLHGDQGLGGQAGATRYYTSADGAAIAVRNASGITWLGSGCTASTQVAVHDTAGTISGERYLP